MGLLDLCAGLDPVALRAKLAKLQPAQQAALLRDLKKLPSAPASIQKAVSRPAPKSFILEVLGEVPSQKAVEYGYKYPWTTDQGELYQAIADGCTRIAVHSGNGAGKSAAVSRIALWGVYESEGNIVITTAPTKRQVEIVLWNEIRAVWRASKTRLPGKIMQTKLVVDEGQYAFGFTAAVGNEDYAATKSQGVHAKNRTIIIVDESSGVNDLVLESLLSMALREQDIIILAGNPTAVGSAYHKACKSWQRVIQFSCLKHPNVINNEQNIISGAVTRKACEEIKNMFGEGSVQYKTKVLGDWPDQSSETLIQLGWWTAAQQLYNDIVSKPRVVEIGAAAGLDVAGEGEDLTVLSIIEDGVWRVPKVKGRHTWHQGRDVMQAVKLVIDAFDEGLPIRILTLDDTGLGQGVSARLRELQNEGKLPRFAVVGKMNTQKPWIVPVNFGSSPLRTRFNKLRDELWWSAREAFRNKEIAIPNDDDLAEIGFPRGHSLEKQITSPIYTNLSNGKLVVLDKRDMKGANIPESVRLQIRHLPAGSPDIAHSLMLALWGWRFLKPSAKLDKAQLPSNGQEWFDARVRQMLDDGVKKKKTAPIPPWMRQC